LSFEVAREPARQYKGFLRYYLTVHANQPDLYFMLNQ
jgi:quinol monooxygenase YgiN